MSRHRWRSRAEIQSEVDLLRFLKRRGISVPSPIKKVDGTYIDRLDAPEGRRYAVLFSNANGSPPHGREFCEQFGQLIGALHNVTDGSTRSFRRPRTGLGQLTCEPLQNIFHYLCHRPRDVDYLAKVALELGDAVGATLPGGAPQTGMCHGDLHASNLHQDQDGRLTLLDFDCCGYGWRAYDIAVFLWSRTRGFSRGEKTKRTREWNKFLRGYSSVRALSEAELRAVDLFVPLRSLWVMGLNTGLQKDFGRRHWSESYFDAHLRFIRQWLAMQKPL